MIKYLKELSMLNGISGDENEVRSFITDKISGYADSIETDNLGNLIVFKKGEKRAKNKLMLAAHTDEVGLIVTNITEDGYLRVAKVGGINDSVLLGRNFTVGKNRVAAVSGGVPIHLLSSDKRKTPVKTEDLLLDIGAGCKSEAEKLIETGDSVCFDTEYSDFGEGLVKGKALDDRVGCAILINMIQNPLPYDMYFAFTVQEEVGTRGAKCAAFGVMPDFAIVAEATTAADTGGVPEEKQVCKVGGGAVISFMDRSTIYDRELYKKAFELGKQHGITLQTKNLIAGGNDSAAIHVSGKGVRTAAVSLPCRYLHSPCSVLSEFDIEQTYKIINRLAESICAGDIK